MGVALVIIAVLQYASGPRSIGDLLTNIRQLKYDTTTEFRNDVHTLVSANHFPPRAPADVQ